jgi:hypothetical protein
MFGKICRRAVLLLVLLAVGGRAWAGRGFELRVREGACAGRHPLISEPNKDGEFAFKSGNPGCASVGKLIYQKWAS